ncbi:MAG: multicopper oxidase family protein [Cyanobacteria bacterium]|nr:multicopper oxidase family protein [Cyanobacteriota bacterium]
MLKDGASGSRPEADGMGMERSIGRQGPLLTVNGVIQPSLALPSGGLIRLRLLNASNARIYRLALEGHPLVLIATDGGAIGTPQTLRELLLAPGERADLLVQGNQLPGTYRLLDHWGRGRPQTLATLTYEGAVTPLPLPTTLIPVPALPKPQRTRRFLLSHGMGGMGMRGMGVAMGMVLLINGQPFVHDRVNTLVTLGDSEDWLIVNGDTRLDHPFHLHVNPFEVISRNGRPEPQRQRKDTVLVQPAEVQPLSVGADAVGPGQASQSKPSSWFPVPDHWRRASRLRSRQPWLRRRGGSAPPRPPRHPPAPPGPTPPPPGRVPAAGPRSGAPPGGRPLWAARPCG